MSEKLFGILLANLWLMAGRITGDTSEIVIGYLWLAAAFFKI